MNILTTKAIHYIFTRWGTAWMKGKGFDSRHVDGTWKVNPDPFLANIISYWAAGGSVALLGCGSAGVVESVDPDAYDLMYGVDLSAEAIAMAQQRARPGKRIFVVGDMQDFNQRGFNVIVFPESLYYLRRPQREAMLAKATSLINPQGAVIMTMVDPLRFRSLEQHIDKNFRVMVRSNFPYSDRVVIVFRPYPKPVRVALPATTSAGPFLFSPPVSA